MSEVSRRPTAQLAPLLFVVVMVVAGCSHPSAQPRSTTHVGDGAPWAWVWTHTRGADAYAEAVAADSSGVYVGGFYVPERVLGGQPGLGRGPEFHARLRIGGLVARLNARGDTLWTRALGESGSVSVSDVVLTGGGNLVVAGQIGPDIFTRSPGVWREGTSSLVADTMSGFVAEFDSKGRVRWARFIPDAVSAEAVATDAAGALYVVGGAERADTLSTGSTRRALVWKLAPDGAVVWAREAGRGAAASSGGVAVSEDGVCVVGSVMAEGPEYDASGMRVRPEGYEFTAAYDTAGALRWEHRLPTPGRENRRLDACTPGAGGWHVGGGYGGVLTFGRSELRSSAQTDEGFFYHSDGLVLRLDAAGRPVWALSTDGGPVSDFVEGLATTPDGVVAVGTFMGRMTLGSTVLSAPFEEYGAGSRSNVRTLFLARVSAEGTWGPAVQTVTYGRISANEVAVAPDGSIYVVGGQGGPARYGNLTVDPEGAAAFVARVRLAP